MTMPNASPSAKGRRVKFTPQVIENIKEFVAQGISRDEIANRLRVIILPNGSGRHTADVRGRIPAPGSVGIAHTREQKEVSQPAARTAPSATFAVTIRDRGKEQTSEIPLPSPATEVLTLEAMSRDLNIAELIGQVLVATIKKDMIQKILRD